MPTQFVVRDGNGFRAMGQDAGEKPAAAEEEVNQRI